METGVGDVGTLAQAGIQAFNEGVNILVLILKHKVL